MESSFAQYLRSRTSITDIVGDRIYSYHLPQGTSYPAIVYRIITSTHDHSIDVSPALGMMKCRIQLDLMSDRLHEVSILTEVIRQEMDGLSNSPMGNATCVRCKLINELGSIAEPENASDNWIYRRIADYHIRYRIPVPTLGAAGISIGGASIFEYNETPTGGIVCAGVATEELI